MTIPNMQEKNDIQTTHDVSPQTIASNIVALDVGQKTVLLNFNGGFLSSDAGALLLREVEEQIGLIREMANVIPDSRDARYITHKITDFLTQRVAQIACGYEDANDCDDLRNDPIFKMIAGRYPEFGEALASQPTMSRFENSISRTTLYRLARVFADIFIASYEEPLNSLFWTLMILMIPSMAINNSRSSTSITKNIVTCRFMCMRGRAVN